MVQLICELLTVKSAQWVAGTNVYTYIHTIIKWCWHYCRACTCMYVQVLKSLPLDLHHPQQELTAKDVDLEALNSSIAQLQSDTSDKDAMIVSGSFYLTWYVCVYVCTLYVNVCTLMYLLPHAYVCTYICILCNLWHFYVFGVPTFLPSLVGTAEAAAG